MSPRFSVIIPAYNSAAFISKGIGSVLGQTCGDFELLLVDDGSKDDTLAVCRNYEEKDSRVRVLHQENQGHTGARNTGLKNSQGEYVLFLDSDDWLDLNTLEVCENLIRRCGPDVIVFGLQGHRGDTGKTIANEVGDGDYPVSAVKDRLLMGEDGRFVFPKSLSGKVFRRGKVMDHQLGVPKEVMIGEDGACFVLAVLSSKTVSVTSSASYHFEVRNGSVSHSGDAQALRRCGILLEHYRRMLDLNDPVMLEQYRRTVVAQLYTAVQFVAYSEQGSHWLGRELRTAMATPGVKEAIRKARFNRAGKKMQVKQLILRYRLLWLVKPMMKRKMG